MNENGFTQITATGAAITVYTGFVPGRVTVTNIDQAVGATLGYFAGMADGSAFKTTAGGRTKITTNGISLVRDANGIGIQIGADTDVNVAGNRLVVECSRGGEGNQTPNYPTGF